MASLCTFRVAALAVALVCGTGGCTPHVVDTLVRACAADDARACFRLAATYADGQIVARDRPRAAALLGDAVALARQQCLERRAAEACHLLAARLYTGLSYGLPSDQEAARTLFRRACDLGSRRSCAMLQTLQHHGDLAAEEPDWFEGRMLR